MTTTDGFEPGIERQEHGERSRSVSLVLARIRLVTDRGSVTADGEGYGAVHALRLAANAVERQVIEGKTDGQSKKHPTLTSRNDSTAGGSAGAQNAGHRFFVPWSVVRDGSHQGRI